MWKCQCGQENDDFSKFCPACGSRMNASETGASENAEESASGEADSIKEKADESSIVIVRSTETWTCSCGETNPGKSGICRACGKSSFDGADSLAYPVFEPPKEELAEYSEPAPVFTPEPVPVYTPAPAAALVSGWKCSCGYINTEGSNFCSGCGYPNPASFTAPAPAAAPVITPEEAPVGEAFTPPSPEPEVPDTIETAATAPVAEAEPEIKLPMTTSSGFEGKKIAEYIDVVCGADMYTTGGFANSIQYTYSFEQAKKDLLKKAYTIGADAVISIKTTVFSPQDTVVIVSVSGTAVKFESAE